MTQKNEAIAKEVLERKELWTPLRRAMPVQQIRRIMREKHILNKDLAERLGVTEASISRLLKGQQNLQLDTLYQLADALEEKLEIVLGNPCTDVIKDNHNDAVVIAEPFENDRENVFDMNKYRSSRNAIKDVSATAASYKVMCF